MWIFVYLTVPAGTSHGKPFMASVPLHTDPWLFLSPSELILSLCPSFKHGLKRSISLTPIATLPVLPLDPWLKLSLWFSLLLFLIYILYAGYWLIEHAVQWGFQHTSNGQLSSVFLWTGHWSFIAMQTEKKKNIDVWNCIFFKNFF